MSLFTEEMIRNATLSTNEIVEDCRLTVGAYLSHSSYIVDSDFPQDARILVNFLNGGAEYGSYGLDPYYLDAIDLMTPQALGLDNGLVKEIRLVCHPRPFLLRSVYCNSEVKGTIYAFAD